MWNSVQEFPVDLTVNIWTPQRLDSLSVSPEKKISGFDYFVSGQPGTINLINTLEKVLILNKTSCGCCFFFRRGWRANGSSNSRCMKLPRFFNRIYWRGKFMLLPPKNDQLESCYDISGPKKTKHFRQNKRTIWEDLKMILIYLSKSLLGSNGHIFELPLNFSVYSSQNFLPFWKRYFM